MEEEVEEEQQEDEDEEEAESYLDVIKAIKDHIHKLSILELRREIDLYYLFANFTKLRYLHLTLGRKKAGKDFENRLVGMKISDMHILAGVLPNLPKLVNNQFLQKRGT